MGRRAPGGSRQFIACVGPLPFMSHGPIITAVVVVIVVVAIVVGFRS
jgi:hypothetical protein